MHREVKKVDEFVDKLPIKIEIEVQTDRTGSEVAGERIKVFLV